MVSEKTQGPVADVEFEHVLEEPGAAFENREDAGAKARGAIQRQ